MPNVHAVKIILRIAVRQRRKTFSNVAVGLGKVSETNTGQKKNRLMRTCKDHDNRPLRDRIPGINLRQVLTSERCNFHEFSDCSTCELTLPGKDDLNAAR